MDSRETIAVAGDYYTSLLQKTRSSLCAFTFPCIYGFVTTSAIFKELYTIIVLFGFQPSNDAHSTFSLPIKSLLSATEKHAHISSSVQLFLSLDLPHTYCSADTDTDIAGYRPVTCNSYPGDDTRII
jgi:hypothetical protein